jgi:hypothetical protein
VPPEAAEKRKPAIEIDARDTPSDSSDVDLERFAVDRDAIAKALAPAPIDPVPVSTPAKPSVPPPTKPATKTAAAPRRAALPPPTRAAALPAKLPPALPPPSAKAISAPPPPELPLETVRTQMPKMTERPPPGTPAKPTSNRPPPFSGPPTLQGAPPPPAAPARRAAPRKAPAARAFEGSVGTSILRFVARRYGERALKTVLDSLPVDARDVFSKGVAPGTWISFEAVTKLVEAIDAKLGGDDLHLIADCGRAVAEGTFPSLAKLGPQVPPELLLAEMPGFVDALVRGLESKVRSVGRGYGRLEVDEFDHEPSLTTCVLILGFLDRALTCFGAREVEVNLLTCRYLGDDENLYDISWLIT